VEPQSFLALEHKLLNQHHDHYVAFTRLVLSLAAGSFSLLAVLGRNLLQGAGETELAKAAFPLLLLSILAGLFVQHRIMLGPQIHLADARAQLAEKERRGDNSPIELRRRPSLLERFFYRVQMVSFFAAFAVLALFMLGS
jgi:hypothetical protein